MKKKHLFLLLIVLILVTLFVARKFHLQNFWKGKVEMSQLTIEKSIIKTVAVDSSHFIYIAHAGGGYGGNTYLNNLEAIDNSYRLGVSFIELDFHYTSDSAIVLSHDFVKLKKEDFLLDKTTGTHLSLRDLMQWLADKKVHLVTDIKTDNIKTLQWMINNYRELSRKIIPQAYTISEIIAIKKMGYENVIFTNYFSAYPNCIIKELADTKILFAITMPYDINFKTLKYFTGLKTKTRILTHTVNDENIASALETSGCYGIYTDFLLFRSSH